MKTLIKNGHVITAVDDYKTHIFIDGGAATSIVTLPGNDGKQRGFAAA